MSTKIKLPRPHIVAKWNEEKVIRWLKKVNLEDCTTAFESRHIDGEKLLELTEQILFTYQDVKIKHRSQIAKCVNECKSQASNAKRFVGTIRHRPPNKPGVDPNADYEYNSDEFDDWDSDFDEDFDDESIEESATNVVPISITPKSVIENQVTESEENILQQNASVLSNVPNVQAVPSSATVDSKPPIKLENRSNYPRPPLKRPPSQPPPPPVPQMSVQDILEEYEIPITHQNNSSLLARKFSLQESMLHSNSSQIFLKSFPTETYEPIEPADENYEIVEAPPLPDKPLLFPRYNGSVPNSPPPPPIPHKPLKFQTGHSSPLNHDTFPAVNRPKLPMVDDSNSETAGSLAVFMNSILGRRSSTPSSSPKMQRSIRDLSSNLSSADSQSSRSSSPEKEGLFMVGSSAFFSSPSSSWSSDTKVAPQIPVKSKAIVTEDIAQTMASRPLPPVPVVEIEKPVNNQHKDLQSYPWFHEVERADAENEIKNLGVSGAFLVRPSRRAGKENPYTVTILYQDKIFHLNIRQRLDDTYALGKEKKKEKTFPSVSHLITYHQKEKILLTSRGESAGQTTLNAFPEK